MRSVLLGPKQAHSPTAANDTVGDTASLLLSVRTCLPSFGALVAAAVVGLTARATAAEPGWRSVTQEDGISVFQREVPGRGFPTFRALGTLDASLFEVLAVLSDVARHPHWMHRCSDARILRKVSELEYVVYSRTGAPWPVADRDAVFHSTVHATTERGQRVVEVRFRAVASAVMPQVPGVVRMTSLRGHYKLRRLGQRKTLMDYEVDADPAGSIPRWIARLATRKLPLETIRRLRKQVQKARGWYADRIERWQALEQKLPR